MAPAKKPRSVMSRKRLTFARVDALLRYDSKTGHLYWKPGPHSHRENQRAGYIATKGYRQVMINGIAYMAQHLIWLLKTGTWPTHLIDHKNRKTDDNRWKNLRKCTLSQNKCNQKTPKNNHLGHKGVTTRKNRPRKFRVRITLFKKTYTIGHFFTVKEACAAYKNAAKKLHGEFANPG